MSTNACSHEGNCRPLIIRWLSNGETQPTCEGDRARYLALYGKQPPTTFVWEEVK